MPTPTRLYVGRLTNDIRRRDLEYFFRGCGRINEILIKEGFAFVEIDDDRDAREAIRKLNGRTVNGCRVHVEYSRGERRRDDRRGGDRYDDRDRDRHRDRDDRRSHRYGKPRNTEFSVKVDNLSSRVTWQDLKDFMRTADVEVTYADANRRERGVGFVDFATASDMRVAIQKLDGTDLFGRKVRMEEKKRRSRSRSRSHSPVRRRSRTRSRSRSRSRSASRSRSRSRSRSASKNRDSEVSRSPKSNGGSERSRSASPANGIEANGGDGGDSPRQYVKSPRSNPQSDDERPWSEN